MIVRNAWELPNYEGLDKRLQKSSSWDGNLLSVTPLELLADPLL